MNLTNALKLFEEGDRSQEVYRSLLDNGYFQVLVDETGQFDPKLTAKYILKGYRYQSGAEFSYGIVKELKELFLERSFADPFSGLEIIDGFSTDQIDFEALLSREDVKERLAAGRYTYLKGELDRDITRRKRQQWVNELAEAELMPFWAGMLRKFKSAREDGDRLALQAEAEIFYKPAPKITVESIYARLDLSKLPAIQAIRIKNLVENIQSADGIIFELERNIMVTTDPLTRQRYEIDLERTRDKRSTWLTELNGYL
jgi:hypothetical protein